MRKVWVIFAAVAVLAAISWWAVRVPPIEAGQDNGQRLIDAYLDPTVSTAEKTEFHRALRAFLHEGGEDVGTVDISDLRAIYGLAWGKASTVRAWGDPARAVRLWRMNFALGMVRYGLNAEQVSFLSDLSSDLDGIDRDRAAVWDAKAASLFPREVGRGLFATIGLTGCTGSVAAVGSGVSMLPSCVCTTHAGNWSCNDSCQGAGTCSVDPGNCGILWLYDCNGMCDNSNEGTE